MKVMGALALMAMFTNSRLGELLVDAATSGDGGGGGAEHKVSAVGAKDSPKTEQELSICGANLAAIDAVENHGIAIETGADIADPIGVIAPIGVRRRKAGPNVAGGNHQRERNDRAQPGRVRDLGGQGLWSGGGRRRG